jgi:hypothetical protein
MTLRLWQGSALQAEISFTDPVTGLPLAVTGVSMTAKAPDGASVSMAVALVDGTVSTYRGFAETGGKHGTWSVRAGCAAPHAAWDERQVVILPSVVL